MATPLDLGRKCNSPPLLLNHHYGRPAFFCPTERTVGRSLVCRSSDGLAEDYPDQIGCSDFRESILESSYNCLDFRIILYREVFLSFSRLCKPDNLTLHHDLFVSADSGYPYFTYTESIPSSSE
jgi:hypothetical protein